MIRVLAAAAVLLLVSQAAPQEQPLRVRVQAYMDAWQAAASFPGAGVGVVLKDGTAFGVVTGVSDRATKRAVTVTDLFLAGSTGKTFFAALAVEQIEAGTLDLDAPVSKYLGNRAWFARLPNAKDITVRHLMTHTSGLVRYEMNPKFTADLRAQPDKAWTPEEEIAYLLDAEPPFAAGQGWDYSDTNYIVLGMILEEPLSSRGARLSRSTTRSASRFLQPLQLERVVPSTSRRIPGLVNGYAGPARSARPARRSHAERRVRHQPAVRMDRRRLRHEPAGSRALGARAVRREGAQRRRDAGG